MKAKSPVSEFREKAISRYKIQAPYYKKLKTGYVVYTERKTSDSRGGNYGQTIMSALCRVKTEKQAKEIIKAIENDTKI